MFKGIATTVIFILTGDMSVRAAAISYTGSNGGDWAQNSNWSGGSYPGTGDYALLDKTARLASVTPNNIAGIRIGTVGSGILNITNGAIMTATASTGADSQVGSGSGHSGTVNQSSGSVFINELEIGRSSSTGVYNLSGGSLIVSRASGGNSLYLGTDDTTASSGTGSLVITGGSFLTRQGVYLGSVSGGTALFSVEGSLASTIGIGSSGSLDGTWTQNAGSTLRVRIDRTSTGVTPIFVDDVEGVGGCRVEFENGALLDVGFTGAFTNGGTFTVMEWEGSLTNNGLVFAPGVDTNLWSFNLDETNKRLTVTAQGDPILYTNVTVNSIAELRQYAKESGLTITMTPGTYWMDGAGPDFLDFSGSNNTVNLAGVTILMPTAQLPGYGLTQVHPLWISGDGVVLDGLTLTMVKDPDNGLVDAYGYPQEYSAYRGMQLVTVTGSDTTVRNCEFTTGGSYPYGYGDAFGKGTRPTDTNGVTDAAYIAANKQSGFRIADGAGNVTVENVILNMRSFGHGFFMQLGAHDILFRNCQVLGDTMADSDDIIAHPEYQKWGFATYKEPIPSDIRISKSEDAFRTYTNPDYAVNGWPENIANVTITNCLVERMRVGVVVHAEGYCRVYDTQVYECEMGLAANELGESTVLRCKGDALNGPLIYFDNGVTQPATYEVELTGSAPGHGVFPVALISGTGNHVTLTSSAAEGVYSREAYVNTSQQWREWRHRPAGDIDELVTGHYADYTTGSFITNLTGQILVFGKNATGNTGCVSTGGVINKGANNEYIGETLVPAPIVVQDTWSYPPNSTNVTWAQYSDGELILPTPPYTVFSGTLYVDDADSLGGSPAGDGGTTVSNGTLEVAPGFALQGEAVVLFGSGTDGQGALYSDGSLDNATRLNSSSGSITLASDTSIGVGTSGNQLLVGPIGGTGSLTKVGAGTLTMESTANSFSGSLMVSNGWVKARPYKAKNDLVVAAGAGFAQNGALALNQGATGTTTLDGTLDMNVRGVADPLALSANIGSLNGGASGVITSTSTAATQTVNINSSTADSSFSGSIQGRVSLVKNGSETTLALNGTCTHTEGTFVNAGWLGGTGSVGGNVMVASGAGIAPGNGVGTLTTGPQTWNGGAALDVQFNSTNGPAGTTWDRLLVNGTVTLDASVTAGTPFQVNLSGPTVAFDNRQSNAWLIVDATGFIGGFSADKFMVNASAFATNNPLAGGQFSVLESGGDLHLSFTPAPYTLLETWRLAHFGSTTNAGPGADGADPDGDGRKNIVEYATGTEPNAFTAASPATAGITPDGLRLTVTFNRITDPALVYSVAAANSLHSSWTSIWSSTGPSNTVGTITVSDPEPISDHSLRFLDVSVSY